MSKFDLSTDIHQALIQYPSLNLVKDTEDVLIEGQIIFTTAEDGFDDRFNVVIKFPQAYPYRFPIVKEIGKRIPPVKERHINGDGYLCLGVEPEELIICKDGINLLFFLKNVLIPHLAREVYVEIHRKYPHGERPHYRRAGNMDFYYEKMRSNDSVLVLKSFCYIASNRLPKAGEPCICRSGTPFKDCHEPVIRDLEKLPPGYISNEIKAIYTYLHRS